MSGEGALLVALLLGAAAAVLLGRAPTAALRLVAAVERCVAQPGAPAGPERAPGRAAAATAGAPSVGARARAVAARLWLVRPGGRERQRAAARAAALEAVVTLAASLRAGLGPAPAWESAAEVMALAPGGRREVWRHAATAAAAGHDVAAVLHAGRGEPGRSGDPAVEEVLRAVATCWQVCGSTGAGLALALDQVAEALGAAQRRRAALGAQLAGPRTTARLLAALPVAGLLLAGGLGADPAGLLLGTPLGLLCLLAGVGLDLLGVLWMRRLVAGALRTAGG